MKTCCLFFAFCFLFLSCEQDGSEFSKKAGEKILPRTGYDYTNAGNSHNEGLDLFLSEDLDWENFTNLEKEEELMDIIVPFAEAEVGYTITNLSAAALGPNSIINDPTFADFHV